jgi:hypothetical protein
MAENPDVTKPIGVLKASTGTKIMLFVAFVLLFLIVFAAQSSANWLASKGSQTAANLAQGAEGTLNSMWS